MKRTYEYYTCPVPHFIIKNVFDEKTSNKMFGEILKHENEFQSAFTGKTGKLYQKIRTNTVLILDTIYRTNRNDSIILKSIDNLILDEEFQDLLSSSIYPLNEISMTNTHETQISRYGNNNQKYDWHVDRFDSYNRHITAVYYFNNKKTWSGGDLELSEGPHFKGKMLDGDFKSKTITPEPNSMVVFGSAVSHRVKPTSSKESFKDGRFSANIWIGKI
jgi:Rps23 Pro-64 3,4-dihydroxylase Tpa1-like proline 4-hydroxylase